MPDKRLYNSRIVRIYLNLVKARYPHIEIKEVLDYAGIEEYEATDAGCWFTQSQVDRFNERLVQLTGNPGIAREGGRYAASRDSLGFVGKYVLGLMGPANAFFTINKSSANFTRSSSFEARRLAPNRVEITVTPLPGVTERPFQCQNRIGFFEAMLDSFDCPSPAIDHPECTFRGDPCCRYVVTWGDSLPGRLRSLRNWLVPLLFLAALILVPSRPEHALLLCFLLPTPFFALGHLASHLEKRELYSALANLKESTDELLEQTALNYENALMVNEIGQAISKQADTAEVLGNIVTTLENRLGYDRGMILLADPKREMLSFHVGFGYEDDQLQILQQTAFRLDNPDSKGLFVTCYKEQKPFLINDFSELASQHSPQSVLFARQMTAQAFVCCAIVCEGESLGVLAMDNVRSKRALVGSDLNLLMGIAPVIGMSIRNAICIDRERRMAEQLRHSQKMEAIGELASGVAHDFNNLLTAIIGFATLAQADMEPEQQPFQYLEEVLHSSERATYLTRGLLAFGRKQAVHPHPVDLNGVVRQIDKLLRRLISERIELKLDLCEESLTVLADPGQLDQVIINLATNARDAMNNAGSLTISTGCDDIGADFLDCRGQGKKGRYAKLAVRDTGKGMDEETRARLFEPFFTTKEQGQGTGLGLAIVYGIVQQSGGFIDIASAPGEGATFLIYLPLVEEAAAARQAPREMESWRGSETVLVAEDAPEVRRVAAEALRQQGYRVVEAADGKEALEQYLAHQDQIKLVVMDVVMPRMNGRDAFDVIAKCNPELKVLFTSAYPQEDAVDQRLYPNAGFLPKPCSPKALLKAVRSLLAPAPLALMPGAAPKEP